MAKRVKPSNYPGFNLKIKNAREAKNLSQRDFAELLGVRKGIVSNWERNINDPSEEKIIKICEILCIEMPELAVRDKNGRRSQLCTCVICSETFTKIANTTGKYCSPKCWYSSPDFEKLPKYNCQKCGEEFQPGTNTQKFCSKKCYTESQCVITYCKICENEIPINYTNGKIYCSDDCKLIGRLQTSLEAVPVGTKIPRNGYIKIKVFNDYNGNHHRGWTYEHRYVMEQHLGRALYKHENVHHKDGNKLNNDISNLELWSKSQPAGQRVQDKLEWARKILEEYKDFKME